MSILLACAVTSGLIFISWILTRKVFLDFNRARLFSKYFRYEEVFFLFFLLTKNSDQGLVNERYYFKKTRSNEIELRFQNRLLVLVVLTNSFRKKNFNFFLNFAFICYNFVVQQPIVPIQRPSYFLEVIKESRHIIQLLSQFCFNFGYNCFKKIPVNL